MIEIEPRYLHTSPEAALGFRKKLEKLLAPRGHHEPSTRPICCTPTYGNYGEVAYWVIVLEGSPPKGALIVQRAWGFPRAGLNGMKVIFINAQGVVRARNPKDAVPILSELLACLEPEQPHQRVATEIHEDGRFSRIPHAIA